MQERIEGKISDDIRTEHRVRTIVKELFKEGDLIIEFISIDTKRNFKVTVTIKNLSKVERIEL